MGSRVGGQQHGAGAGVLVLVEDVQVVLAQFQVHRLAHLLLGVVGHLGGEQAGAGDFGLDVEIGRVADPLDVRDQAPR